MVEWINGGGFYLVQAMREYSAAELKAGMETLELQIQAAELYWAAQKEKTA